MNGPRIFTLAIGLILAFAMSAGAQGIDRAGEAYLFERLNDERVAHDREPLSLNPELSELARKKAQDMAQNHYFDHISPTFGTVYEMLQEAGMAYKWAGENIARVSSTDVAHRAFMESPDHRANILSAGYTQVGIGLIRHGGKVYVCQIFSRPRSGSRDTAPEFFESSSAR